jgi:aminoglycoside/choline kinase family phosphotransferase
VSAVDSCGRTIFTADAHRGGGKRFVVHTDENLTAFVELESAIQGRGDRAPQISACDVAATNTLYYESVLFDHSRLRRLH